MGSEIIIAPLDPEDKTELRDLAYNNGGNKNLTSEYIDHWYYKNPSGYCSLWKAFAKGKIEGFATTNNFEFVINGKICRVAMPQNVLTSVNVRGKGVFNKLYFKTEADNIENNKTDYFLTFTNKLSTPIFLNKFGYANGKCPPIIITFFNLVNALKNKSYKRVTDLDSINIPKPYSFNNALNKTTEHIKWRYSRYSSQEMHIIEINKTEKILGYAFLKAEKKKGIPFLILMDIFCENEESVGAVIAACRTYTAKNFFLFMIMFELIDPYVKKRRSFSIKDRFNFLVKGKTADETKMLSWVNFNFFFGDLDIL